MFGQQNNSTTADAAATIPEHAINKVLDESANTLIPTSSNPISSPEPAAPTPPAATTPNWQHPGSPIDAPAVSLPTSTSAPAVITPVTPAVDDLADIKQKALSQLSPLVGHLDQSPEEEFRTTMMMIQATDDQSLVKAAYAAANKITDEKTRAQALLDIVNEINYFTQQHTN